MLSEQAAAAAGVVTQHPHGSIAEFMQLFISVISYMVSVHYRGQNIFLGKEPTEGEADHLYTSLQRYLA
jgi:hypothetical protein